MTGGPIQGAVPVMADAQFGTAKVLRPYPTYQAIYQGRAVLAFAIGLFEEGVAHDPNAGKPGYSPTLCKGLAVPYGARVVLWLPTIGDGGRNAIEYKYNVIWRCRNIYDFRTARLPYHVPKQSRGVADTTPVTGGDRVVIPAASSATLYVQAQPSPGFESETWAYPELLVPGLNNRPINIVDPNGTVADIEQGVFDVWTTPGGTRPTWQPFELQACGDEMILTVSRAVGANGLTWDFTNIVGDQYFAEFYNNSSYAGVYAFIGSAP